MKNNFLKIFIIIIFNFFFNSFSIAIENFNFNVTELEIKEKGNKYYGKNGGVVTTTDGLYFKAKDFQYDKISNILILNKNVEIFDRIKNYKIYTDRATYLKNSEKIFTEGNSKAISIDNEITITANRLSHDKNANVTEANGKVKIVDTKKDYVIFADKINYFKDQEKCFLDGKSRIIKDDGVVITSDKMSYDKKTNLIESNKNVEIFDRIKNYKIYTDRATYLKNSEKIFTEGNSKAISIDNEITITANRLSHDKNANVTEANGKVKIVDTKDYVIFADKINYFKDQEKITTNGDTKAIVEKNLSLILKN